VLLPAIAIVAVARLVDAVLPPRGASPAHPTDWRIEHAFGTMTG
jgi:hypothetical protein